MGLRCSHHWATLGPLAAICMCLIKYKVSQVERNNYTWNLFQSVAELHLKYIPISGRITRANIGPMKACQPKLRLPTLGQRWANGGFLCQLTCQSANIMSSLYGVGLRVRVNNFSKTARPRDMLFFFIPYLSRWKIVQGMQICKRPLVDSLVWVSDLDLS